MLVSLQWLREFTPYEGQAQALGDRLTMLGLELEEIKDPFAEIAEVVIGHVVECGRHPEADKLSVCRVDVGDEVLDIVCGAPNVGKGQKVAVAKVGTTLPGGLKLKKAKLRGQPSNGMILSEREMELSDNHEGILVLPDSMAPGERLVDALGLEREVLDIDITPNRADCLSHLGIAREAALAFKLPLALPKLKLDEGGEAHRPYAKIVIDDAELCPMYSARYLRGAKIGPSPAWMRYRLHAVGVRAISNLVDVTNYILMELGQPLHAFDWDLLRGDQVRIAPAEEGAKLTTLDGQERTLLASDLLIWDGERPIALAGVMGGLDTEINAASTNVLLEGAVFRPGTIRKTARRLALHSEASYRFERGVDQVGTPYATARAAQLMAELSGAQVLPHVSVAEPRPWQKRRQIFRRARLNSLIGIDFTAGFCRQTLEGMGCVVDDGRGEEWVVSSPSHRLDLEREVDLFEEIARVHGLDRIPEVLPRISKAPEAKITRETAYGFNRLLKTWARGAGLREAVNYSFVGQSDLDKLGLPVEGRVAVANPLSEDQNVLRTALSAGLLTSLRNNLAQGNNRLRLFEIAKVFHVDRDSDTETCERTRLGVLLYGNRFAEEWPWPQGDADYLDVKGLVEQLLDQFKLGQGIFSRATSHPFLEPCVDVSVQGRPLGVLGMVRPDMADAFHARKEVWMAELDVDLLREMITGHVVAFAPLPKLPPVRRDVTFRAPVTLEAGRILEAIDADKPTLLESATLVAVYAPESDAEQRNLSFRMTYRHAEKTLKDKEVDKVHTRLVQSLMEKLSVKM
ncbi:MAG: phenylalanine--tRNA ligase subunit beta [Desulfovibrionaceae bacterium]